MEKRGHARNRKHIKLVFSHCWLLTSGTLGAVVTLTPIRIGVPFQEACLAPTNLRRVLWIDLISVKEEMKITRQLIF